MARAGLRHIVLGLAATSLLMGCVEGGGKTAASGGAIAAPSKKAGGSRDVEAPEIFDTTDSALWDGRPSLGGIWVASPEATDPQRVVMFNPATGATVTGALFRRERDNPGPTLQLSSDAAEALGILAGQPTEIKVTALRKETEVVAEAEPAEPTEPAAEGEAPEAGAQPGNETGEAAAIASAALAAVNTDKAADAAPSKAAPAEGAADTDPAAATDPAATSEAAAGVTEEQPKRKTWKERRAEAKAAREAKKKAAAEAKAAEAAAKAAAEGVVAEDAVPTATADAVSVAPIESAPLDARKPDVAKAEEKAVESDAKAETAAPAEVAAEPVAEPAPAAPTGSRPIQVASFSKEDNAKRAAEALAKIGITATPQKSERDGKAVWGVVVMGDDAMLKKIKDAGFADAYYLK